ncbi:signal peptidase IB [Deinococcus xinjiangensis]|uniref:Signal peptidase I n=1 Tax=Deinococcus xinjiangensis TaxID=457454 RepID=A0ABP9VA96_9DEIO
MSSQPPAAPSDSGLLREVWRVWILGALLPVYLVTTFICTIARVDGDSMEPTLQTGQLLLLLKYPRWLRAWHLTGDYLHRGDVVIFKAPADSPYSYETVYGLRHRPYNIKRVIGLAGDKIEIKDGQISVNGQKLAESYASTEGYVTDQSEVVPAGKVWVMGDNRRTGASLDSRAYGAVDLRDVAGTANLRLWPDAGLLSR